MAYCLLSHAFFFSLNIYIKTNYKTKQKNVMNWQLMRIPLALLFRLYQTLLNGLSIILV